MDNHTLTPEQKRVLVKALEKFSQMQLGQTSIEQRDAKELEKLITRSKDITITGKLNSSMR